MVGQAALFIVILVSLLYATLSFLIRFRFKNYNSDKHELPFVTVLLPCRNEANNLPDCLKALENIDYPSGKIRFLVTDDDSEDETAAILKQWATKADNRTLVPLSKRPEKGQNGKALALAEMATQVKSGLLVFTDADCIVPPTWCKSFSKAYREDYGLVTGITTVTGDGFFARMQALDWWLTLGKVKVVSDAGYSLTAMGNNMAMGSTAYLDSGGFGKVAKNVTEDLAMSIALYEKGYRPIHIVSEESLVKTKPEKTVWNLLQQRKRWMRGAFLLPLIWQLLLGLQVAFYAGLILGLYFIPLWTMVFWLIKTIFQSVFISTFASKTMTKISFFDLIYFEIYNWWVSWATVIFYFYPVKLTWKNRNYS
ncbi:glycosyltransferase [Cyclobacterium qasimii]|uniref:Glycosyl transferase, family 2 n=2 Tax=Cyclobacterium qasimii TaxID=1350429 RepID=S7V5U5_9BACT|nr:glycosyltransferase [Cyclobacterium qasimii]EPR65007.1 glycosyl transferase, family 2 [Cyclobacterium qasimii M12-11B]GEO20879.1 glycosyl transferase [Cyclobacterium qasimii]